MRTYLRLFSFVAVFIFAFSASLISLEAVDATMPLDQVKPGMHGYGYSVFSGTQPERFDFVVRSIVPDFSGWPNVITVQLSGGPVGSDGRAIFENSQIFAGMSGSPMYVDGKLIGGLAMAPDFATTAKALVTPIEYQLGMAAMASPEKGQVSLSEIVQPGQYLGMCLVYGDSNRCSYSTVTANKDGQIFTTSHGISGLKIGKIKLPVFMASVADLIESQSGATKLSGQLGEPVGTADVHGPYGFVVIEGKLPATVPVHLKVSKLSAAHDYRMAYDKNATGALREVILTDISQMPLDVKVAKLDISVHLNDPPGVVRFYDRMDMALIGLERLLDTLLDQKEDDLEIASIEIVHDPLSVNDLWTPISINMKGRGQHKSVSVIARRGRDNKISEFSLSIDFPSLKGIKKDHLKWCDGETLARLLLQRMPVASALAVINEVREREGIYLICDRPDKDLKPTYQNSAGSLEPRATDLKVLLTLPISERFSLSGMMEYKR